MTNVYINGRYQMKSATTGVERWAGEVVQELGRRPGWRTVSLAPAAHWASGSRGHLWEQFSLPARSVMSKGPLLSPANFGPIGGRQHLLVLHDIAPLIHPRFFAPRYVQMCRWLLPRLLSTVSIVLTVSQFTKSELIKTCGIRPEKVAVVGGGGWRAHGKAALAADYYLFVGAHDARKNIDFLLDLWPEIYRHTGRRLIVTCRSTAMMHTARSRWLLEPRADQPPWLEIAVDPTDAELGALYSGAIALLQPSYYEGLGLPILEAASWGVPFVSTDVGVAREVAGGESSVLPLLRDPWVRLLKDPERLLSIRGAERSPSLAQYTWPETANRVADQIASVAG